MPIRTFLSTHKDTITGLGFVAGLIGLGFTAYQISNTNNTLQATNAYVIQKDARELIGLLREEPAFVDYVVNYDPNKQYSDEVIREANRSIGLLINFYLAVFRQYKTGGVTKSLAISFGKDFCEDAVRRSIPIDRYFRAAVSAKGSELKELQDAWCP